MRDLSKRVHAGVGPSGSHELEILLARQLADRAFELTLHGAGILLLLPAAVLAAGEFDGELVAGHSPYDSRAMSHKSVHAENLPKPVGPYSPGVSFERLVFVSGQGATDPATGQLAGADVATQTEQCLKNLQAILKAGGSDLQYVIRCGVFLIDMKEFQQMNAVYSRVFGDHRPARTTIQAAGLPGDGLRVEIDCVAYIP